MLLKDPVNTIGGIGQSICDTADEKGVAYSSGYIVTEVVTALLADKGLDKLKNVAKTGKTADNVADIAEGAAKGAGNAAEDAGKVVEGGVDSIIKNGKVSVDDLKANPSVFSGKSADEIAQTLTDAGYDVTIQKSARSKSGAQIIKINNPGGGKNISQVQVSPGGGRHGGNPYVKISTTDQGIIKIVNGSESLYKTDGKETATIIFSGGK